MEILISKVREMFANLHPMKIHTPAITALTLLSLGLPG